MTRHQLGRFRLGYLLTLLLLAIGLTGCEEKPKVAERAYIKITGYNHTEDYIHQFYVDQGGGGNVFAYSGGGGFVCCIGVPGEWRPGLTATVRWTTSSSIPGTHSGETWHEQVVPIEPYGKEGTTLNVHFLPLGKVRLIISMMGSGNPNYPGPPYPEKPADWPY